MKLGRYYILMIYDEEKEIVHNSYLGKLVEKNNNYLSFEDKILQLYSGLGCKNEVREYKLRNLTFFEHIKRIFGKFIVYFDSKIWEGPIYVWRTTIC